MENDLIRQNIISLIRDYSQDKINEDQIIDKLFNFVYVAMNKFETIDDVLEFHKENKEKFGINKDFSFLIENNTLYLLMRADDVSPHQEDLDGYGEKRNQWPENYYDGIQLYIEPLGKEGVEPVKKIFNYFNIEIL